jgi:hypothetical protein
VVRAARGDPVLLHRLQQRRLRLGRRAVDLVGEQEVGEDRALDEAERALAGGRIFLEHVGAGDVGRHQVGRELDAAEREVQRLGQRRDEQRLGQARDADEQAVAAREQRDEQVLDHLRWPLDLGAQVGVGPRDVGHRAQVGGDLIFGRRRRGDQRDGLGGELGSGERIEVGRGLVHRRGAHGRTRLQAARSRAARGSDSAA